MDAAKALRRQLQINAAMAEAKANGGCPTCFQPFDPEQPSCHSQECRKRWEEETTRRAACEKRGVQ